MSVTSTVTESKTKTSNKEDNIDEVLKKINKSDYTCSFTKCKNRTKDFAIQCKYCNNNFCTTHGLPEIHGCGEAVRRDEKRKFLHPEVKLTQEKHTQVQNKLSMKLKQMQFERKSKQGSSDKKK